MNCGTGNILALGCGFTHGQFIMFQKLCALFYDCIKYDVIKSPMMVFED